MTIHIDTGIDQDAYHLTIEALSDVYSHRAAAVVREYTCNALDEHDAAGIDRPVDVYVTLDERKCIGEFRVVDYGRGMDLDTLTQVYTQIKLSSKRGDAGQTGGFGIGCKSAFSLADGFDVLTNTGTEAHMLRSRNLGDGHIDNAVDEVPVETSERGTTVVVSSKAFFTDFLAVEEMLLALAKTNNLRLTFVTEGKYHGPARIIRSISGETSVYLDPQASTENRAVIYPARVLDQSRDDAIPVTEFATNIDRIPGRAEQVARIMDDVLLRHLGMVTVPIYKEDGLFGSSASAVVFVSRCPYPFNAASRDIEGNGLEVLQGLVPPSETLHAGFVDPILDNTSIPRSRESVQGMTVEDVLCRSRATLTEIMDFYVADTAKELRVLRKLADDPEQVAPTLTVPRDGGDDDDVYRDHDGDRLNTDNEVETYSPLVERTARLYPALVERLVRDLGAGDVADDPDLLGLIVDTSRPNAVSRLAVRIINAAINEVAEEWLDEADTVTARIVRPNAQITRDFNKARKDARIEASGDIAPVLPFVVGTPSATARTGGDAFPVFHRRSTTDIVRYGNVVSGSGFSFPGNYVSVVACTQKPAEQKCNAAKTRALKTRVPAAVGGLSRTVFMLVDTDGPLGALTMLTTLSSCILLWGGWGGGG